LIAKTNKPHISKSHFDSQLSVVAGAAVVAVVVAAAIGRIPWLAEPRNRPPKSCLPQSSARPCWLAGRKTQASNAMGHWSKMVTRGSLVPEHVTDKHLAIYCRSVCRVVSTSNYIDACSMIFAFFGQLSSGWSLSFDQFPNFGIVLGDLLSLG